MNTVNSVCWIYFFLDYHTKLTSKQDNFAHINSILEWFSFTGRGGNFLALVMMVYTWCCTNRIFIQVKGRQLHTKHWKWWMSHALTPVIPTTVTWHSAQLKAFTRFSTSRYKRWCILGKSKSWHIIINQNAISCGLMRNGEQWVLNALLIHSDAWR